MSETDHLAFLRDPRLGSLAASPLPAWLWALDGNQILWANAGGAAMLGAPTLGGLTQRRFDRKHPAALQVMRLADSLPPDGAARLERLRGFAPGVGRLLTCSCARVTLADGTPAILVAATEPAGPSLPLPERIRRLFDGVDGPFAAFSREGGLLHAAPEASRKLGPATSLAAAGAAALAPTALAEGCAAGETPFGLLTLERIGTGNSIVLLATFAPSAEVSAAAEPSETNLVQAPAREQTPDGSPPDPAIEPVAAEAVAAQPVAAEPATAQPATAQPATVEIEVGASELTPIEAAATAEPADANAPGDVAPDHRPPEGGTAAESTPLSPDVPGAEAPPPALAGRAIAAPEAETPEAPASETAVPEAAVPEAPALEAPESETPMPEAAVREAPAMAPERPIRREAPARPSVERRQPLRFVWQIDAEGRFTVASEDFVEAMGPQVAATLGRPWAEVAADLGVDAEGRVAQALASHDTFSGIVVAWPVEGATDRLPVELSGLPTFERDRSFRGYRGFGVCRDVARLNAITAARRAPDVAPLEPAPSTAASEPHAGARAPEAASSLPAPAAPSEAPEAAESVEMPSPPAASPQVPSQQLPAQQVPAPHPAPESAEAAASSPTSERPLLSVVPPAKNVVPFRPALPTATEKRPTLTPVERNAFQEIAKALGARVEDDTPSGTDAIAESADRPRPDGARADGIAETAEAAATALNAGDAGERRDADDDNAARSSPSLRVWPRPIPSAYAAGNGSAPLRSSTPGNGERAVLDRLPIGVLIYRDAALLHANRALLDWTGYEDIEAIAAAGGLERLFAEPGVASLGEPGGSGQSLAITTRRGESLAVEARLFSVPWHDGTALLIVLMRTEAGERVTAAEDALRAAEARAEASAAALAASDERIRSAELALRSAQAASRELESVLETATDGVLVVDPDGMILSSNRSAEALLGYESHEIANRSFVDLFAPESHRAAHDYLNGLIREGVASVLNDGREVIGRVQQGGLIPLFMTIGRIADGKFCVVFRDITQWKRAEEDLTNAKREAEKASSAKSDFLAKVSHEIRTPLNAIIGFAEVMMEERFGPISNERYRQYLKDIRISGEHVISLVNDLLDLSKIEAGKLDLTFVSVSLNELVQQCVAIMQPQANRERIIIRTSLLPTLPPVVADERSIRQIVLNLLSNSIKFTGAGGQVIVSTALTDQGEAVLRVRDTGIGMSEKEIETALEPFRQVATSGRPAPGTGLGLPLTKVLAEANRASFSIKSAVDAGTLVEIAFPATRVLAE